MELAGTGWLELAGLELAGTGWLELAGVELHTCLSHLVLTCSED